MTQRPSCRVKGHVTDKLRASCCHVYAWLVLSFWQSVYGLYLQDTCLDYDQTWSKLYLTKPACVIWLWPNCDLWPLYRGQICDFLLKCFFSHKQQVIVKWFGHVIWLLWVHIGISWLRGQRSWRGSFPVWKSKIGKNIQKITAFTNYRVSSLAHMHCY